MKRRGPEQLLERWEIEQTRSEGQLEGDPPEKKPVREHSHRAKRRPRGSRRKGGADLTGNYPGKGHRGRLQVRVVQRAPCRDRVPKRPAAAKKHEEESSENERGGDPAHEPPPANEHPPRDHALVPTTGRSLHQPGLRRLTSE